MHIEQKIVLKAKLDSLHNWLTVVRPTCFKCKRPLTWDQRRFWEEPDGGRVYFFCDCGFENPLSYLQFKWETEQELLTRNIKTK